jgi:hypothetical protein
MEDWVRAQNLFPWDNDAYDWSLEGEYVIKNPLNWTVPGKELHHDNKSVASFKNFVFEFDDLPMSTQEGFAERFKDSLVGTVFSGHRSLHLWFHIEDDPPTNVDEYHFLVKKLNEELFGGLVRSQLLNCG